MSLEFSQEPDALILSPRGKDDERMICMIPNLKTDLIEFGKTMRHIAVILLVTFAILFAILISIAPMQGPESEPPEETSAASEVIQP